MSIDQSRTSISDALEAAVQEKLNTLVAAANPPCAPITWYLTARRVARNQQTARHAGRPPCGPSTVYGQFTELFTNCGGSGRRQRPTPTPGGCITR